MELSIEQRALMAGALAAIGEAQSQIMHSLTFLAMEIGADHLPHIAESTDKYAEWLQSQHAVVVEASALVPQTVILIPPLNLDVL